MDASTATRDIVVSVDDIERLGCSSMDENVRSSWNSAADQEQTLEENRAAYLREEILIRTVRMSKVGSKKQELELGSFPECQSLGPFTVKIRQVLQWLLHLVRPWPPLGHLSLLSKMVRFILDLASKCERQHLHTLWKRLPLLAALSEWSANHCGSLRSSWTRVCQGKPAGVSSRRVWWENSPYHTSYPEPTSYPGVTSGTLPINAHNDLVGFSGLGDIVMARTLNTHVFFTVQVGHLTSSTSAQRIVMDASTATRDIVVSVDDIERLGCSSMDENVRSSWNSAADQEQTLEENRAAYLREEILIRTVRISKVGSKKQELELGSFPECQSLGPFTVKIRQDCGPRFPAADRARTPLHSTFLPKGANKSTSRGYQSRFGATQRPTDVNGNGRTLFPSDSSRLPSRLPCTIPANLPPANDVSVADPAQVSNPAVRQRLLSLLGGRETAGYRNEVTTAKQSTALLALNEVREYKVSVTPHRTLNSTQGVISEDDLLEIPTDEIVEGLSGDLRGQRCQQEHRRRQTTCVSSPSPPKPHLEWYKPLPSLTEGRILVRQGPPKRRGVDPLRPLKPSCLEVGEFLLAPLKAPSNLDPPCSAKRATRTVETGAALISETSASMLKKLGGEFQATEEASEESLEGQPWKQDVTRPSWLPNAQERVSISSYFKACSAPIEGLPCAVEEKGTEKKWEVAGSLTHAASSQLEANKSDAMVVPATAEPGFETFTAQSLEEMAVQELGLSTSRVAVPDGSVQGPSTSAIYHVLEDISISESPSAMVRKFIHATRSQKPPPRADLQEQSKFSGDATFKQPLTAAPRSKKAAASRDGRAEAEEAPSEPASAGKGSRHADPAPSVVLTDSAAPIRPPRRFGGGCAEGGRPTAECGRLDVEVVSKGAASSSSELFDDDAGSARCSALSSGYYGQVTPSGSRRSQESLPRLAVIGGPLQRPEVSLGHVCVGVPVPLVLTLVNLSAAAVRCNLGHSARSVADAEQSAVRVDLPSPVTLEGGRTTEVQVRTFASARDCAPCMPRSGTLLPLYERGFPSVLKLGSQTTLGNSSNSQGSSAAPVSK
ncbi:uncharacterized protein ISCGN_028448 [Ixodes scapularis]